MFILEYNFLFLCKYFIKLDFELFGLFLLWILLVLLELLDFEFKRIGLWFVIDLFDFCFGGEFNLRV